MNAALWQPSIWIDAPWLLWIAPLSHLSLMHALINYAALAALLGIAWLHGVVRLFAIGTLLIWPLSTLSLIYSPEVTHYAGLSGVLHGDAVFLAALLIQYALKAIPNGKPTSFDNGGWIGLTLLVGLLVKLYTEQAWITPVVWSADWGFEVAVIAHLYGAGIGLLAVLAINFWAIFKLLTKSQPESA